jgi:hypothetical protein
MKYAIVIRLLLVKNLEMGQIFVPTKWVKVLSRNKFIMT